MKWRGLLRAGLQPEIEVNVDLGQFSLKISLSLHRGVVAQIEPQIGSVV